ncbi:MAG TPA: LCP family protein [Actinomycetota bacterium]|nr:LCP family protein [Actinomycetota bacterium]
MAAGLGVVLVAGVAFGLTRLGGAPARDDAARPHGQAPPTSELLALQLTGTEEPSLALVGTWWGDRPASFFTVPSELMMTVPGQGETSAEEVAAGGPATMRIALSNTFGVWAEHYAVLDLDGLSAAIDRAGGIRVRIPGFYATEAGDLGPGAAELDGDDVAALLSVDADGGGARWAAVVQGLLRAPVPLRRSDLVASSGLGGVRRALRGAAGAGLALFPTVSVAASVVVPQQPELDRQVASVFGASRPVPVIVENGVGTPGLGEDVAALLLPEGFRVAISRNAEPFGFQRTMVVANGRDALDDARRIADALGVGRVGVSQVPSGIGDITIIVGEDFTG